MPADERATLREIAENFVARIVANFRPDIRAEMVNELEQALKEADRLAREDAARIADKRIGDFAGVAAAIRASITTDEGETR